ncbi:hypothetical protein C8R44DRAFT_726512 [Mycena epipterygia]|nr:hypothetical protein C8R44DRAFT_726512 [Mycena epipterygia]
MSSPFAPKLGTNYCPTDEEITEIQSLIFEPALRVQRLDDEIADLQKAIDKLAEERTSLNAYVEAHKALISPVRRLPFDVIQEIFVTCIPIHRERIEISQSRIAKLPSQNPNVQLRLSTQNSVPLINPSRSVPV